MTFQLVPVLLSKQVHEVFLLNAANIFYSRNSTEVCLTFFLLQK